MSVLPATLNEKKGLLVGIPLALLLGVTAGVAARLLQPLEALAVAGGLVAGLLTLARIEAGTLALIFVAYTRLSDVLLDRGLPLSVAELLVAWLLLSLLLRWYLFREAPQQWQRPAVFLGAYGLVGLASLLYAANAGRALIALIDYAQDAILVLLIVVGLQRRGSLRRAVWVLLVAGTFLGILSVFQQVTGSFDSSYGGFSVAEMENIVGRTSGYRIGGPMGAPNFYAMILVPLVALAIDRLWHERRFLIRFASGAALVVILLAIFFTFSRGGFLALALVLVLTLVRLRRHPRLLLGIAIAVLCLLLFLPGEYRARLETIPDVLAQDGTGLLAEASIRGRVSEWIVGWQMFLDHPLAGVGLDNYPEHYLSYSSELGLDRRRTERSPHSLYLEVAAEGGFLGLAAFFAMLSGLFYGLAYAYRGLRAAGRNDEAALVVALATGLAGYLTASIFLHAAYPRFFWTLAGLAFVAPLHVKLSSATPTRERIVA